MAWVCKARELVRDLDHLIMVLDLGQLAQVKGRMVMALGLDHQVLA